MGSPLKSKKFEIHTIQNIGNASEKSGNSGYILKIVFLHARGDQKIGPEPNFHKPRSSKVCMYKCNKISNMYVCCIYASTNFYQEE